MCKACNVFKFTFNENIIEYSQYLLFRFAPKSSENKSMSSSQDFKKAEKQETYIHVYINLFIKKLKMIRVHKNRKVFTSIQ